MACAQFIQIQSDHCWTVEGDESSAQFFYQLAVLFVSTPGEKRFYEVRAYFLFPAHARELTSFSNFTTELNSYFISTLWKVNSSSALILICFPAKFPRQRTFLLKSSWAWPGCPRVARVKVFLSHFNNWFCVFLKMISLSSIGILTNVTQS